MVATTIAEANQKQKRPYNRLTVIYDENSAISKHLTLLISQLKPLPKNFFFSILKDKDKLNCGDEIIVDNCEKCGSGQNGYLSCSGDCKWSNGKCILRSKFLLILFLVSYICRKIF